MTKTNNKNNENEHNHTNGEYCKECNDTYLKDKGVSDNGYDLNPDYIKDEDQIIHLKYFRMIQDDISLVVPKEYYEDGFSLEEYVNDVLTQDHLKPGWEDRIRESKIHYEIETTHPISECEFPRFTNYVSEEGLFWETLNEETKSVDEEVKVKELPELLN